MDMVVIVQVVIAVAIAVPSADDAVVVATDGVVVVGRQQYFLFNR